MDKELQERVMLERVEMIARLTSDGFCKDKDREIALTLIAEIAGDMVLRNDDFEVAFSAIPPKR